MLDELDGRCVVVVAFASPNRLADDSLLGLLLQEHALVEELLLLLDLSLLVDELLLSGLLVE